jgi:Concanavalin A-like lectin/glucanases superfamily/Domain of unknown function (DUF4185)
VLRIRVVASVVFALACAALSVGPRAAVATTSPYPPSPVITGITFDLSRYVRRAPGSDNWALTWSNDDHQYTPWGDGGGFSGTNEDCRVSLGVARVEGSATSFVGRDLWGDPRCAEHPAQFDGKSLAIISIDGTLYMWRTPGSSETGLDWIRLYRSTDRSVTWVDTGVQWTYAEHRISFFAFIQFGRDNQEAPDGYVYVYAVHVHALHFGPQKPGLVYLMRVPKAQLANRSAYQFFSGYGSGGAPLWGSFDARLPVLTDPNGVMRISAMYNPGLNRYLLVTNHTANVSGDMAIFDAPQPWGPWTTVTHQEGWPAGGELVRKSYYWNFSPKWLSADGKDFVLVFTGRDTLDAWNSVPGRFTVSTNPPPPPPPPPPTPGALAALWRFNEGSGSSTADGSGNGLHGSLVNGTGWATGSFGTAAQFDGVDDHIRVSDPGSSSGLDLRTDFSLLGWVRFDALPATGGSRNPRLIQKGSSGGGPYYLGARTTTAPPVVSLRLRYGGQSYTVEGTRPLLTGSWVHVVVTKQAGVLRIYQNGSQDGSDRTVPPGTPDADSDALYLGESPGNSDGALDGMLEEVRIYNRALAKSSIFNLWASSPMAIP